MKKFLIIIAYLTFGTCNRLYGLEIDVTQGRIEPLPVAIVEFTKSINEIVSNNLGALDYSVEKSFLNQRMKFICNPLLMQIL